MAVGALERGPAPGAVAGSAAQQPVAARDGLLQHLRLAWPRVPGRCAQRVGTVPMLRVGRAGPFPALVLDAAVSYDRRAHVLETSPRMSSVDYRARMSGLVDYLSSDFDGGQHSAMVSLDLQQNWLRTASLDVVLSAHVLEHLPDPGAALDGLYRVLRPGGCLLLQVPLPQGVTGRPLGPEYHGDSTLVHWRFGWDLIDLVRAAGFRCTYLVVEQLRAAAAQGGMLPAYAGDDCDVPDLLS